LTSNNHATSALPTSSATRQRNRRIVSFVESGSVFDRSLLELFISHMRNDVRREILHKLRKVSLNVTNCDVERALQLLKPLSFLKLLSREQVLLLCQLLESVFW